MDQELRNKLTSDIIDCIQEHALSKEKCFDLRHLYVHFFTKRKRLVTDVLNVAYALKCLRDDVWSFEDFDLREAARAEVHGH